LEASSLELEDLISIAREAGDALAREFGKKELSEVVGVGHSGDVTVLADRLAEDIILKRLGEIGNIEVMSEEAGRIVFGKPEYRVVLDPLDGSSNYKRGIPVFAVSMEVRTSPGDEPAMAVIYEPMCRRMFSAERGQGAFLDSVSIQTNRERPFEDCLFDMDLHTAADETKFLKFVNAFLKFGLTLKSFRSVGSCAIPLAYTACGILDGFLDFSKNSRMVDIAAGLMILQEAGGTATDIQGKPIEEGYDSVIACSSEQINRKVRKLLSDKANLTRL
jgi:myo-inositol-1(or 4)-monophosphatase